MYAHKRSGKARVYINDWLEFKPYARQVATDHTYMTVANKVLKAMQAHKESESLLNQEAKVYLACLLTSYLEDVVSGTGIWAAFRQQHQSIYGRPLPFFKVNTEEYFPDEVNYEDIAFLVWYFMHLINPVKLLSPYHTVILDLTNLATKILSEEYEYVPENEDLKALYTLDPDEKDYYKVRQFMQYVFFKAYLFVPDTGSRLTEEMAEAVEKGKNMDVILRQIFIEITDQHLHTNRTRLLALKSKEWAAAVLGDDHPLAADIRAMSKRVSGYFFYKGQDNRFIHLEHVASGKSFELLKESFDHHQELNTLDVVIFIGMVRWQGQWWFSGIHYIHGDSEKLVLEERASFQKRMEVSDLDDRETADPKSLEAIAEQQESFLKFNNNKLVAFVKEKEIQPFIDEFLQYHRKMLAGENAPPPSDSWKKHLNPEAEPARIEEGEEGALVFFNPASGIEAYYNLNGAFPLPENKFYDEEEQTRAFQEVLISPNVSKELTHYCMETCQDKLSFFREPAGELVREELDFFLRFWKHDNYWSKPNILYYDSRQDKIIV